MTLKEKAVKLSSEYNRRKMADSIGYTMCVCCRRVNSWQMFDAGHLVAGRKLGILFDDRGIWPVCQTCNNNEGSLPQYYAFLDAKFGKKYRENLVEELRRNKKKVIKFTSTDYENLIIEYKTKLESLNV